MTDLERKAIELRIQQLRSQMRWVGPFRKAGKYRSIQTLKAKLKDAISRGKE